MRSLICLVALTVSVTASAAGQLAVQRPTEKLLIVALPVAGVDSATSVKVTNLTRERVDKLARNKVLVIPKDKICEALSASGFHCDGLMDAQQVRQLARFLDADAFLTGQVERTGGVLGAQIRVVDVGGSGFAYAFGVQDANPGSPDGLAEAIAQRLNGIIRAGERARECDEQRHRGQYGKALETARKALEAEPNLPAAHLCVATTYEAQRLGPDSVIAAAQRALAGDSMNTRALESIARGYQVKGDTVRALEAFERLVRADPSNKAILLALVTQLQLRQQHDRAESILQTGLRQFPGDQQIADRLYQVCIEGGRWQCVLNAVTERVQRDTSLLGDTASLKVAIGAAQQIPDTNQLCRYTQAAIARFPNDVSFMKTRGACFEMLGLRDSAVAYYVRAANADPTDMVTALLAAKTMIEMATWDTAGAGRDTAELKRRRTALAQQVEPSRPFIARGLASPDSAVRLNSVALMFQAGAKLAQAGAYEQAYPWLDTLLQVIDRRAVPASNPGVQQIKKNGSFWYGISSVASSQPDYKAMTNSKSCSQAKAFNERIKRTRSALELSRQVHPPTVQTMLGHVRTYEGAMKSVRQAFKCSNF